MESPTYPKRTYGKALPPLAESVSKAHGERPSCLIPPEAQLHLMVWRAIIDTQAEAHQRSPT